MATQHVETLIIGAGQAGLATGYHLKQRGSDDLIVDGNDRVGDNWRCHWASLRLFTPAKYDGLPGMPFSRTRGPSRARTRSRTTSGRMPSCTTFRFGCKPAWTALSVGRAAGSPATSAREVIISDNVVVATGTRGRTPLVPAFARRLAPSIRNLHSSEYRCPAQLDDGPVLVVGASHSGCEIAYELAEHLPVTLAGRSTGK